MPENMEFHLKTDASSEVRGGSSDQNPPPASQAAPFYKGGGQESASAGYLFVKGLS